MEIKKSLSSIFQSVSKFIDQMCTALEHGLSRPGTGRNDPASGKENPIDTSVLNPGGPEVRVGPRYEIGPSIDLTTGKPDFTPGWKIGPRLKF